jgi:hypothetical protein
MNRRIIILALFFPILIVVGCGGGTSITTTGGNNQTDTTPPGAVPPPSILVKQGFLLPDLPRISAEELKIVYDNREPLTLVDVRPKDLFDTGYIPGARNIPNEPETDSINRLTQLPKDRLIVLYCD